LFKNRRLVLTCYFKTLKILLFAVHYKLKTKQEPKIIAFRARANVFANQSAFNVHFR
jgi:hypothetical protein